MEREVPFARAINRGKREKKTCEPPDVAITARPAIISRTLIVALAPGDPIAEPQEKYTRFLGLRIL
jgi:hypothetical protein